MTNENPYWKGVDDQDNEFYKVSYTKVNFHGDEKWNETIFYQTKEQTLKLFKMCEKGYVDGMEYEVGDGNTNNIRRNKTTSFH